MFQSSKRREQEQELTRQQERIADLEQAVKRIIDCDDTTEDIFEELEAEQSSFDKSLTHVVEYIRQFRTEEAERSEQERPLFADMEEMTNGLARTENKFGRLLLAAKEQEKQLTDMVEQNKHFTGPIRYMNQNARELEQDMGQMEEVLLQMKEFGRQMSVLSLNAAIEAGRMGESGRQFVAASEEVRNFAGRYQEAADTLTIQVGEINRKLEEAREQIEHLTGLLKDNNVSMGKVSQSFQECVSMMGQEPLSAQAEESRRILEGLRTAATVTGEHEQYFKKTLECMEQAGEIYINEQQAMEKLKEQWKRIQLEAGKVL